MRTDRDFAKAILHFICAVALGFLLFQLIACRMTPADAQHAAANVGYALQDAAPWIPAPFNYIADVMGAGVVLFAGHKTIRHVRKRRAAKAAAKS